MIPYAILAIESEDDRAYMTLLYQRHRALMLKTAWEYTREKADVEDIVSNGCVALIQHLDELRAMECESLRRYIVVTVQRKAIDFCRQMQRRREQVVQTDEAFLRRIPDPESVEKKVLLLEELNRLRELLHTLPRREQEILRMKYQQGMKQKDIAQALGIAETTVATYLLRARDHLKAGLY